MKKSNLLYALLLLSGLFGVAYYCLFIPKQLNEDTVVFKFQYMAYACGDCYPQYNLKAVLQSKKNLENLVCEDFDISFKSAALEKQIEKETEECAICYDYIYTGYIKYAWSRGYLFEVEKAETKRHAE